MPPVRSATTNAKFWFDSPKDEIHSRLWPYVDFLQSSQRYITQQNLRNQNLYGDFDSNGISPYDYTRSNNNGAFQGPKVTMNVCKALCDSGQAKLTEAEPLPYFLTEGGDWAQQQRAKQLNHFSEGIFYENDVFSLGQDCFLDCEIYGTGFAHVFREDDKVRVERVMTNEIVVDDNQAVFGKPNAMFRVKHVSRDVLLSHPQFKKYRRQLESTNPAKMTQNTSHAYVHDMVKVVEAWRLPTAKGAGNGLHVIIVENCTLLSEKWEKDYFPIIPLRWSKLPVGYFGKGICASLVGIQIEINTLLRTITKSLRLLGVPRVLIPHGSKINPNHLNNEAGALLFHAPGMQPTVWNQPIMPPEVYSYLKDLKMEAYEMTGINQLSAAALKPSGIDSGVGLRTMADIQTQRFAKVEKDYQRFFLEIARQSVLLARDIAEDIGDYPVVTHGRNSFSRVNWKDIDLSEDDYIMKAWPTNLLPKTPEGRLQQVTEMMAKGLLDQDEGRRLLNYPDTEEVMDLKDAPINNIKKTIMRIVEDGKYRPPEPYQNLERGLSLFQEAYLHYSDLGLSQIRLEMMRLWMDTANGMLSGPPPPPQGAPGPQPPMPQAQQGPQAIQPAAPLAPIQQ